jgi:hypothetical protein
MHPRLQGRHDTSDHLNCDILIDLVKPVLDEVNSFTTTEVVRLFQGSITSLTTGRPK